MNNQELRIVVNAKDNASRTLKQVQAQLGLSAKSAALMGAAAGAAAEGVRALGRATRSLTEAAIGGATDFEQHRIAFETMLGSGDKAAAMLRDITEFAKRTPFDLPGVVEGAKKLLAYNIEQKKLLPTLEALGNIAAGVGRDKLPQLILAFGQVRAAERLTGMELRQFTEAGVPLLQELAKVTGKTAKQIKDDMEAGAAPSFEVVEKAIFNMSSEGGKFFKLMDRQSKTFGGLVANIKDSFGQLLRAAVGVTDAGEILEGSLFGRIKRAAEQVMPAVQGAVEKVGPAMGRLLDAFDHFGTKVGILAITVGQHLEPKLTALWHTVQEQLLPVLQRLWREVLEPLLPVIGTALVVALGLAIDSINALIAVIAPLINFLLDNKNAVIGVTAALAAMFIVMNQGAIITAFNAGIDAITLRLTTLRLVTLPNLAAYLTSFGAFAVFAAAGVAAFVAIQNAITKTKAQLDQLDASMASANRSNDEAIRKLQTSAAAARARGDTAEANRIGNVIRSMTARDTGGPVSAGQSYVVGERQAEVFTPNTAGRILPSARDAAPSGKTTNILSGNFYFSTKESVDAFFSRLDKTQRLARVGMG